MKEAAKTHKTYIKYNKSNNNKRNNNYNNNTHQQLQLQLRKNVSAIFCFTLNLTAEQKFLEAAFVVFGFALSSFISLSASVVQKTKKKNKYIYKRLYNCLISLLFVSLINNKLNIIKRSFSVSSIRSHLCGQPAKPSRVACLFQCVCVCVCVCM